MKKCRDEEKRRELEKEMRKCDEVNSVETTVVGTGILFIIDLLLHNMRYVVTKHS